jgi:hypothetical protein
MSYANIAITLDRYGHLLAGPEAESRALFDAYLDGGEDWRCQACSHGTDNLPMSRDICKGRQVMRTEDPNFAFGF